MTRKYQQEKRVKDKQIQSTRKVKSAHEKDTDQSVSSWVRGIWPCFRTIYYSTLRQLSFSRVEWKLPSLVCVLEVFR